MPSGQIKDTNIRMSIVLPKELKAVLDDYAKSTYTSTNKVITYAIVEYLNSHAQDIMKAMKNNAQDKKQNTP